VVSACSKIYRTTIGNRFGATALVLFSAITSFSMAAEVDTFDDATSQKVTELSNVGKCEEAWGIIWPYVLSGSSRASTELIGQMAFGNMRPPMMMPVQENDKAKVDKAKSEGMRFAADLAFFVDPKVVPEVASLKQELLSVVWDKEIYSDYVRLNCVNGAENDSCLNPNRWRGMVTKLSEWNKKFRVYEKTGIAAGCWRR
jgi:hypothetical protein